MTCAGLPGFAQHAMYRMFDVNSPSVFSFSQEYEHIVRLFRKNTIGGICNVYQRHATTRDDPNAAHAAKYNAKGIDSLLHTRVLTLVHICEHYGALCAHFCAHSCALLCRLGRTLCTFRPTFVHTRAHFCTHSGVLCSHFVHSLCTLTHYEVLKLFIKDKNGALSSFSM